LPFLLLPGVLCTPLFCLFLLVPDMIGILKEAIGWWSLDGEKRVCTRNTEHGIELCAPQRQSFLTSSSKWLPRRVVNFDSDEKSDQNGVIWLAEDSCNFFNQNFSSEWKIVPMKKN
jgi:hypothetical protein